MRKALLIAGCILAVLGLTWWAIARWRTIPPQPQPDDPRLTYDTPYQNVRPQVQYVGDEKCTGCHQKETQSYRRHRMGRSFARVTTLLAVDRYDQSLHNPFELFNTHFLVERRGERVFHRATRRQPNGNPLFDIEAEVHYVLGSGTLG